MAVAPKIEQISISVTLLTNDEPLMTP